MGKQPPAVIHSLAVGLKKGYPSQKRKAATKPVSRKGANSKRSTLVRGLIRQVAGFAPYEKRMMELLRVSKDKRCLKLARARLGTHKRAKAHREAMADAVRAQKDAARAAN